MSNISTPFIFGKQMQHTLLDKNDASEKKLFVIPFVENDVLDLQAMFVKPGIHIIKTKNIIDGRKIITTILDSLNYYNDIGCISQESYIPQKAYDIIGHIKREQEVDMNLLINLENFFLTYSHFDFIWVEFSKNLEEKCSLKEMNYFLKKFHVEERIPVIIVEYQNEV